MRGGLPEGHSDGATNQHGARGEGAGARTAHVRPRRGCPRPSQARGLPGLGLRPGTTRDEARAVAKAKTLPEGSARGTGPHFALAQRRGPCFPALGSTQGAPHPSPSGIPRGHLARPCMPQPYLVGIRERRRKSQPQTVAVTTYSYRRSTSHSNPGKMARRRGCGRGACVNGQRGRGRGQERSSPTQVRMANLRLE